MIELTRGDLLSAGVEALVNAVNCVGVMGRGIALQFKNAFPRNFTAYAAACKRGEVQPGHMLIVETGQVSNPRYIVNFETKRHWKGKSRLSRSLRCRKCACSSTSRRRLQRPTR